MPYEEMPNLISVATLDCDCAVLSLPAGYGEYFDIEFCQTHATAPDQVTFLMDKLLALTPGGSEYSGSPQRCLDWIKDRMAMTGKIAKERNQLRGQVADLLVACEAVEWVKDPEYNDKSSSGFGMRYCPWCGNYENYGHDKDCQRQAAIARARTE